VKGRAVTDATTTATTTPAKPKASGAKNGAAPAGGDQYQLPVIGVRVPAKVVNVGFWGGLAGAAVVGVVDPPLALLVGAGVLVARHQTKK
jgi:hypothetical protein